MKVSKFQMLGFQLKINLMVQIKLLADKIKLLVDNVQIKQHDLMQTRCTEFYADGSYFLSPFPSVFWLLPASKQEVQDRNHGREHSRHGK
jgi:hypothetical protein